MSMCRRCDVTKANDGHWYLVLGDFEHAYDDDECTAYGPFTNKEALMKELDRHSNPGGMSEDDSGTLPPPRNARRPVARVPFISYGGRLW